MRLVWSERAIGDLERVADRAPRAAGRIFESVVWLSRQSFPRMYRRVRGHPKEHVLVVDAHVVTYNVDGETLTALRILDGRRERVVK